MGIALERITRNNPLGGVGAVAPYVSLHSKGDNRCRANSANAPDLALGDYHPSHQNLQSTLDVVRFHSHPHEQAKLLILLWWPRWGSNLWAASKLCNFQILRCQSRQLCHDCHGCFAEICRPAHRSPDAKCSQTRKSSACLHNRGCVDLYTWLSWRCYKAKGPERVPLFGLQGLMNQLGVQEYAREGEVHWSWRDRQFWEQFLHVCSSANQPGAAPPNRVG